jgi:hypothetical protein
MQPITTWMTRMMRTMTMKRNNFLGAGLTTLLLLTSAVIVFAEPDAVSEDNASEGLGPKQMNHWMEAQLDYSHAVQKYGKASPEATQAQVAMNTLARELGITPTGEVPQFAPMEPAPPPAPEPEAKSSPPLNAPAPTEPEPAEPVLQESGPALKN